MHSSGLNRAATGAVTATLLAALLAACGSQTTQTTTRSTHMAVRSEHPPLGTFAGYTDQQQGIAMLRASWRVPRITIASGHGSGSTWIGVQQPSGGTAPFIQVGTTDDRDRQDYDYYDAFWSDTTKRFRPVSLFRVNPGDRITATLQRSRATWRVEIADHTLHTRRTIATTQEAGVPLQQAEWLQEDPGSRPGFDVTTHTRYALTDTVRFSRLSVNRQKPSADELVSQAMTVPGAALVPSRLVGDSFSLRVAPR
jgi:hypothetical protein